MKTEWGGYLGIGGGAIKKRKKENMGAVGGKDGLK